MSNNKQKSHPKAATHELTDTGERMVPSLHKGHLLYGEHIVRYESVAPVVEGKIVLDIASGSGYGSATIAKSAKFVYGVDVSQEAVDYANDNYAAKNIQFLVGDGVKIPLDSELVDVVVTFETIEHIEDYMTFLKEIKRVLKPEGLLIVSTPNDLESPEGNHFHVHEFEYDELNSLLKKTFKYVEPFFQGTWLYTALVNEKQLNGEWRGVTDTMGLSPLKNSKAMYFFFLCSAKELKESLPVLGAISEHYSVKFMEEHNKGVGYLIDHLRETVAGHEASLGALKKENDIIRAEISQIKSSKAWKAVSRARSVKSKLTGNK